MVSEASVTREHGHQAESVDDDQREQTATRVMMASRERRRRVGCVDEGEAERNVNGGEKGRRGKGSVAGSPYNERLWGIPVTYNPLMERVSEGLHL